jgi:Domain of unknown function (DUF4400)
MLFFKHAWIWVMAMVFFVFTVPILPNEGWFSAAKEIELNRAFYGEKANAAFVKQAQTRFHRWFVATGAYELTLKYTEPKATRRDTPKQGEFIAVEVSAFRWYVEQFWDGMVRALYRWEVNLHWYVIATITLFAGVNEGLARRKITPTSSVYISPANFHLVGHFLIANIVGALLVLPWLPIAMTWWLWIAVILVLSRFWVYATMSLPTIAPQRMV